MIRTALEVWSGRPRRTPRARPTLDAPTLRVCAGVACAIGALTVAACGSSAPHARVRHTAHACVPYRAAHVVVAGGGSPVTRLTVRPGTVVWVELVEPEADTILRTAFPWRTPASSDQGVISAVSLCKHSWVTSLPVTITAFRALRPGTATLEVALTRSWRGRVDTAPLGRLATALRLPFACRIHVTVSRAGRAR
jgi:hypothetical protein